MAPNALPPLDRLDPVREWQPWQPDERNRWDRKWAGHLYRRAAFGASLDEMRAAEQRGPRATLDLLFQGDPGADELLPALLTAGQFTAEANEPAQLRGWWLYCMLHSGHPLREKLTLFWHNHFATSIAKVNSTREMFEQNKLLREHALGKFGPFLLAMSKDAAMLHWLDSNSNIKGKPNENYAREVMELFSLGVGHYTEKDIRQAARAFTGWHTDSDGFGFEFNAKLHDDSVKTVLGQTGNWNGDDVLRIILNQPAAARFLVRKLYRFYVSETNEPSDSFLEPLAESFRKSDYDISALVRTMLSSRHFFSDYAFRQRIKSPVEFVLGAVRAVYRDYDPKDKDHQPLTQQDLVRQIDSMGQLLFAPPNVKGWRGAKAWLNTSTVLSRDNFAQSLATGTLWGGVNGTAYTVYGLVSTVEVEVTDEPPGTPKGAFPEGHGQARGSRAAQGVRSGARHPRGEGDNGKGHRPCVARRASARRRASGVRGQANRLRRGRQSQGAGPRSPRPRNRPCDC